MISAIESLMQPVSEDQPCGENLEYDSDYTRMGSLLTPGSGRITDGDSSDDSAPLHERIDWKELKTVTGRLAQRTRDLKVQTYAAIAGLHVDGLAAFRDHLQVLEHYLENYWDEIYPRLDPDDQYDATARMMILQTLKDNALVLLPLSRMKLVRLKGVGEYDLNEIILATDDSARPAEGQEAPDPNFVAAAFREAGGAYLDDLRGAVDGAHERVRNVVELWGVRTEDQADPQARGLDLEGLDKKLGLMSRVLAENAPPSASAVDAPGVNQPVGEADAPSAAVAAPPVDSIASRADVVRVLERICDYYDKHEPASPVPLLLRRAQRLVDMSFLEILEDMVPDGLNQARIVGGVKDD